MTTVPATLPKTSKVPREPLPGGQLVPVGDLVSEAFADFSENIGPYAMAALGILLVTIPVTLLAVLAMYFLMFVLMFGMVIGMAASIAVLGEDLGMVAAILIEIVSLGGLFAMIVGLVFGIAAVIAPFNASAVRAIAAYQRGEADTVEISAAFKTVGQDLWSVLGAALAIALLSSVAIFFCYVPILLVPLFFGFGPALVALHRMSARQALGTAFRHAKGNLGWYLPFTGVWIAITFVSAYVPVLGHAFAMAFHVRAHRYLFGDAEEAVIS